MKKILQRVVNNILVHITLLFGVIFALFFWIFTAFQPVPMWVMAVIIVFAYGGCILVYVIARKNKTQVYVLPRVLTIHRNQAGKITLIVEENEILFQNALVTIYYHSPETDVEVLLGVGFVENIASNKNVQVVFIRYVDDIEVKGIKEKLLNNKVPAKSFIVKPSISKTLYDGGLYSE